MDTVTILGARGSIPASGKDFQRYGGATTCIFLRLSGQPLVLDAGTGILDLPRVLRREEREISILLSHPHVDHLLGLPMCPMMFHAEWQIHLYAERRGELDAEGQLCTLMKPPLWPVTPADLPARLHYHTFAPGLSLGAVRVETMEGVHPGGVTLFRLSGGGKRVVFATDCSLTGQLLPPLADFARDCDLLLCDGQYSEQEWPCRCSFGHSTWIAAAQLGKTCGAARVRIIHHDPARTDQQLDAAAGALAAIHPQCSFAYAGEEIKL